MLFLYRNMFEHVSLLFGGVRMSFPKCTFVRLNCNGSPLLSSKRFRTGVFFRPLWAWWGLSGDVTQPLQPCWTPSPQRGTTADNIWLHFHTYIWLPWQCLATELIVFSFVFLFVVLYRKCTERDPKTEVPLHPYEISDLLRRNSKCNVTLSYFSSTFELFYPIKWGGKLINKTNKRTIQLYFQSFHWHKRTLVL